MGGISEGQRQGEVVVAEVTFTRQTEARPDGRVRVTLVVRQAGRLLGRITQAGPLWRFTPTPDQGARWKGRGMLWRTAEEARRGVAANAAANAAASVREGVVAANKSSENEHPKL